MSDELPVNENADDVAAPESLEDLSVMVQAVADEKRKAAEYFDQLLRLKAEFDNYRKRVEKEKIEARQWGKQDVLMPLLSFADIFEQAMTQAPHAKDIKPVIQGLQFLSKSFNGFLKDEGLEPIGEVGQMYDPHVSEALDQVEVDGDQVGKIIEVIQRGYALNGRVIRPSRVRVGIARKGAEDDDRNEREPASTVSDTDESAED